tara:strand:- start:1098 stop:2018 length:921 start_codon:yes stop_codon:yes gene_type:complete
MTNTPLVSILMNCFNGELFLKEALESIIKQSYKNWELIFWDNKSSDNSIKIVSKYNDKRIKIFSSIEHTNLGKARKNAFKKAQGDYLAFLDVDDFWAKDKLKNQLKLFEDNNVGIAFTNSLYFSKKRKKLLYSFNKKFAVDTSLLITNYPLSLNSIMIDINKLKTLDYHFDENYNHICDFDLMVRLSTISKVKYLNQLLSGWRIHGNNESFKRKEVFNKEKEKWCEFHLNNKFLAKHKKELKELKLLIIAEERILNYKFDFNALKNFKKSSFSNLRNFTFVFLSFIPFFPKIAFQLKDFLYKLRWH